MKVSKVLEYLASYDADEELIIAWWDKETVHQELSDEQWSKVVQGVDKIDWALDGVSFAIEEAVKKIKKE